MRDGSGSPPRRSRRGETEVIATRAGRDLVRYADDIHTSDTEGAMDELALYAGQSARIVSAVKPDQEIVMSISSEARAIFACLADPSADGGC